MGFGSQFAKAADAELAAAARKDIQAAAKTEDGEAPVAAARASFSPAPSAPASVESAPPPARPLSTGRPTSFGAPSAAPSAEPPARSTGFRPTSFGGSEAAPASPAPASSGRPTSFQVGSGPVAPRVTTAGPSPTAPANRAPPAFNRAPTENGDPPRVRIVRDGELRLERLIEEVGIFKKASLEDMEKLRRSAAKNPEALRIRLEKIYTDEIKPFKEKSATDIARARVRSPGDVVFSISIGANHRIQVVPRAEAVSTGLELLDGAQVVSYAASHTPFPAPAELFGVGAGIRDAAAPAPPAEPVRSPPRP